ncbi:MAG: hypothetical protein NVS1B2_17160 [Vulcanimicrobiaceae bacterium]
MHPRSHGFVTTLALLVPLVPLAARAGDATSAFTPPKLTSQGHSSTAVAGAGTVVVKVLVAKTGAATVQGVIRSTNHGDDAAALEIARTSTYRPAMRGATPQTAFYDFTLKFAARTGASNISDARDAATTVGLAAYERQIRLGNYGGAQSGLRTFVAAHPGDAKAELDLAVATAFLGQASAAADGFDRAGTVPGNYAALAAKAYNDAAGERLKAKDYAGAVSAAKHAVALNAGPFTYNTLGTAEDAAGDHTSAIVDLEKARSLATSAGLKSSDRATIDVNLATAYLAAGKPDDARPIADEIAKLDPSQTNVQTLFANYYAKSANDLAGSGKFDDAAALYEKSAAVAPAQAVSMYTSAALAYLKKTKPDNERAKADADKALAIDPDNASANFAAGIALANQPGRTKDALPYLNHADASAKKGSDPTLTAAIENLLRQLGGK